MDSISLMKPGLKTSLVEAMFTEVLTNSNNYYYFLGRTLDWNDEDTIVTPTTSQQYELQTRSDIVLLKKISAADISLTVPRYDWTAGTTYDMYDDAVGKIIAVSNVYGSPGNSTPASSGVQAYILTGTFDPTQIFVGDYVSGTGIAVNARVVNMTPTQVTLDKPNTPNFPTDASITATFRTLSTNGYETLEDSRFYAITRENNVYKCLDNNGGAPSTVKPYVTTSEPFILADGYKWKYMYSIPSSLANRFLTDTDVPVTTSIKNQYYSRGSITSAIVTNYGSGYGPGDTITVYGDGHRSDNIYRILAVGVITAGYGYKTSTVTFSNPPVGGVRAEGYPIVENGTIIGVALTNAGSGYLTAPTVTFAGAGVTEAAVGDATISNGSVAAVSISNSGAGYPDIPKINVDSPFTTSSYGTIPFIAGAAINAGQYVNVDDTRIYYAMASGSLGLTHPTHESTDPVYNGNVPLKFVGMPVNAIAALSGGTSTANGEISSVIPTGGLGYVNVTYGGEGYIDGGSYTATITNNNQGGSGATVSVNVSGGIVRSINILTRGSGYRNASVIISDPFNADLWSSIGSTVTLGQKIKVPTNDGVYKFYEVTGGVGSSPYAISKTVTPSHDSDPITRSFGDANLTYIGKSASASAEIYYGYGYSTTPNVSIEPPYPYPDCTFWKATTRVEVGSVLFVNGRFYEVLIAGITGVTAPTSTLSSFADGNAALKYLGVNKTVDFVANTTYMVDNIVHVSGKFYLVTTGGIVGVASPGSTTPEQVFTPEGSTASFKFIGEVGLASVVLEKTKAQMTPIIEEGQIVGVLVQDPGQGYTAATLSISGAGTGAEIIPNFSFGELNSRQANIELSSVPGTIDAVVITHPGAGISAVTSAKIIGDGVGADIAAVLNDNGTIDRIEIINRGQGYTNATVVLTVTGGGTEVQPYARAIISPVNGHGKNAVRELFARSIVLSTSLALEKNQGFLVTNAYRQAGIIKNPFEYSSSRRYTPQIGSACFVVTSNFDYNSVAEDTLLVDEAGNQYRVVARPPSPGTGDISVLIRSVTNAAPIEGKSLRVGSTDYHLTSVVYPTVNKYSGDLLFVDNRESFIPTSDQTLSIRSVIRL